MGKAPQVITAGDLFLDLIMSGFEGWPEPGKEVFASHFRREIGGGAMITACGLARLGTSTAVLGMVGTDSGDWVLNRLQGSGVDTSMVQFDQQEPTACTVIATGSQDRAFLSYLGASRGFEGRMMSAAKGGQLSGARHAHLAYAPSFDWGRELIEEIHHHGATVSLDVGWREDWLSHRSAFELLRYLDIFFPNESEACRLTGEEDPARILVKLADAGVSRVALKLGSSGAALLWNGEMFFADPHPIQPVDTTGAGDSFDAGFLYAWLNGETPEACLRIATVCGAISTEAFGGIDGFPTPARLFAELAKGDL
jgi:sugar/nucleoside kinase (ribokinase family)